MSLGKDKVLIQVAVSKNTKLFLDKYSKIFKISISEFCHSAIVENIIKLTLSTNAGL